MSKRKTEFQPETVWVVSLDRDSFNYVAVEHPKQKVLDHNKKCSSDEIVEWMEDKEECQERCDQINSL